MDVKNVRKWCREFTAGHTDIHDEERSSRPSTSDETIAKIEAALLEDRRVTLKELTSLVPDVSQTTIYRILTEKLQYHKMCARRVPRMLTYKHKQQRVQASQEFIERCANKKDDLLNSIVTGDKT